MAIASMTGFAREEGVSGPVSWAWEIRSVNGRGLDVRLRNPPGYDRCGEVVRQELVRTLKRGACHVGLVLSRAEGQTSVRINADIVRMVFESFAAIDVPAGVQPLSLDAVLGVRGVIETVDGDAAIDDTIYAAIEAGGRALVAAVARARAAEGQVLEGVLSGHLDRIQQLTAFADAAPGRQPEAIRKKLADQIALLTGAATGLDPQRLHQEAVLLASRTDVREEIDRLNAHIAAARLLLAEGGPVGRKLDFLAQELGRESNTLCAKANDAALSAAGLELKTIVEQFREQVQNVE